MKRIFRFIGRGIKIIGNFFKTRLADFVFLIGLIILGYGLWIVQPWLSYSIIGSILLVLGYALGRSEGP